eukprot:g2606.t1
MERSSPSRRLPGSDFVLSGTSAVLAICCTNPVDVVKTRLQLQGERMKISPRQYRGVGHALVTIARAEGLRGLQRGLAPACLLQFSNVSMRFGCYAVLKRWTHVDPAQGASSFAASIALGGISGFAAAAISNPFFLLKTRAQAHQQRCQVGLCRSLLQLGVEGWFSAYRGFGAFAPRVMAASAVQLSTYDRTKAALLQHVPVLGGDAFPVHFCASWITGAAVVVAMQPFDFAATRMMNQGREQYEGQRLYTSPFDCLRSTVRNEGFTAVFSGMSANYLRFAPYCILVFVFLEQLKKLEAVALA